MLQRVNVHAYIHSQSKDNDDLFSIADAQLKAIDETLLKSCIGIICCAYSGFWNTINQSMEQLMTIITQWKIHLVQRDAVGLVESESIANLDVEADHVSKKQKKSDLLRDEHKGSLDSNGGYLARMEWLMNELSVHVGYCILLKKSLKVEFEGERDPVWFSMIEYEEANPKISHLFLEGFFDILSKDQWGVFLLKHFKTEILLFDQGHLESLLSDSIIDISEKSSIIRIAQQINQLSN